MYYYAVYNGNMHIGLWHDYELAKQARDEEEGRTIMVLRAQDPVREAVDTLLNEMIRIEREGAQTPRERAIRDLGSTAFVVMQRIQRASSA